MGAGININVFKELSVFSEEMQTNINNGQYPLILAKDGQFTLLLVSEAQLAEYSHYDALDEAVAAQHAMHGPGIPIVYDGFDTGGIPAKVLEAPTEPEA